MAVQSVSIVCYTNQIHSNVSKAVAIKTISYQKQINSNISKVLNLHKSIISYTNKFKVVSTRKGEGKRNALSHISKCNSAYKVIYPYILTKFDFLERQLKIEVISSDNK